MPPRFLRIRGESLRSSDGVFGQPTLRQAPSPLQVDLGAELGSVRALVEHGSPCLCQR